MPYGGSVTISFGLRSPRSRATSSALVELAAQHAVLAAEPQIAEAGRRDSLEAAEQRSPPPRPESPAGRRSPLGSKPVRLRSKSASLSSCSSSASSSSSQCGPCDGAIHHQAEGLHLGLASTRRRGSPGLIVSPPGHAQLARGLQPEVTVHHLAVAARQHRNLEAELADAAAHAIDRGVVLAGIACVEDQSVDRPNLDLRGWTVVSCESMPHLVWCRNPS